MSSYRGNSIFRNQPPHTHFSKSFEDSRDALFLALNEIDPFYLQAEQRECQRGFETQTVCDPRTKEKVEECYDHTRKAEPQIFEADSCSSLTKEEHTACLRFLQSLRECKPIEEEDLYIWRTSEGRRLKEKQRFQKSAYEYTQTYREQLYAPAMRMVRLYREWFRDKVQPLLEQEADVAYNTHAGLPHVRVCKALLTEQVAEMVEVRTVARLGKVWLWHPSDILDCSGLKCCFDTCARNYREAEDEKTRIEGILKAQMLSQSISDDLEKHTFGLPLESLLFLLTAGDYPDLPTEMLLEIRSLGNEEEERKCIVMESPLPARNCGWHTHKQMMEQAVQAYLSLPGRRKWLLLEGDKAVLEADELEAHEIEASTGTTNAFKPVTHDEYMATCRMEKSTRCNFNAAAVKWSLHSAGNESDFHMITTLALPPSLDTEAKEVLGSFAIKLEYKPRFGCEIMTKYELLQEWLSMCLLNAKRGKCLRISARTYETQVEEELTLRHIEQQLGDMYHINMSQLLSNLYEFLKLLIKMPSGQYMLRYNPKFKDQLLLCAPTQAITQNTISLHSLLREEPTDVVFMSRTHFLPIVDDLCSIVHLHHNVLPCAFKPSVQQRKKRSSKGKLPSVRKERVARPQPNKKGPQNKQKKVSGKEEKIKMIRKKSKAAQRARRRQRMNLKKSEELQERKELEELQRDMLIDRIIFGN